MNKPRDQAEEPATPEIDERQLRQFLQELQESQSLGLGLLGGLIAAAVGAVLWALITTATGYQLGVMAVGVGFLVGLGVRYLGKGIDISFGIMGAGLALLACLVGNVLVILMLVVNEFQLSFWNTLRSFDLALIVESMKATFGVMDLAFYAIAVYVGYKLSFRQITEAELAQLAKG